MYGFMKEQKRDVVQESDRVQRKVCGGWVKHADCPEITS